MRCLALLSALCAFASSSPAAIVEYRFSGVIETIFDPDNQFGGVVHVGDPFLAKFRFETGSQDLEPADPMVGRYHGISAFAKVDLPMLMLTGFPELLVQNPSPFSNNDELHFTGLAPFGSWLVRMAGPPTTFSTDSIPTQQLPDVPFKQFYMSRPGGAGSGNAVGTVTSAVLLPEPTSILILSCLGVLIFSSGRSLRGRI